MARTPEQPNINPYWEKHTHYPNLVPDFKNLAPGESYYGAPTPETLALFSALPANSLILEAGVGEGARYAMPLAKMGHRVVGTDVDRQSLERLKINRGTLPENQQTIYPVFADAFAPNKPEDGINTLGKPGLPFGRFTRKPEGGLLYTPEVFDGALNAGFIYVFPPEKAEQAFTPMVEAVKPGGLIVAEISTNRVRDELVNGKRGESMIGPEEYNYKLQEGLETFQEIFDKSGVTFNYLQKHYHNEDHYYLDYDLILAYGNKKAA